MEPEVADLIRLYLSLTPTLQAEAVNSIHEYIEGGPHTRNRIANESISKGARRMDVGPVDRGRCPVCGK